MARDISNGAEAADGLRYEEAHIRRERILDLVRESAYYSLAALGRELAVSDMTVRRDVKKLADQGLVRVVHGGVSAVTDLLSPVDFRFRTDQHIGAKRAIASYALSLIQPNSVVGLDAGTTVLEVARQFPSDKHLTAVTNSLPVMAVLARRAGVRLISLGGTLNPDAQEFVGSLAIESLTRVRIHTLFLAASAVAGGAMWCTHEGDAEMKQALVASADEVVLLLDSSKFFYSAVMKVADLSAVSTVITDQLVSDSARHAVEQAGAGLVVVQAEPGDLGGVSEALDPNADDASVGPASSSEDTASARSADQGGIE